MQNTGTKREWRACDLHGPALNWSTCTKKKETSGTSAGLLIARRYCAMATKVFSCLNKRVVQVSVWFFLFWSCRFREELGEPLRVIVVLSDLFCLKCSCFWVATRIEQQRLKQHLLLGSWPLGQQTPVLVHWSAVYSPSDPAQTLWNKTVDSPSTVSRQDQGNKAKLPLTLEYCISVPFSWSKIWAALSFWVVSLRTVILTQIIHPCGTK